LAIKILKKDARHGDADPDVVDDHDQGDGGACVNRRKHRDGLVSSVVGRELGWQVQSFLDSFPWREECFGSTFPLEDIRPFPVDSIQDLLKLWIVGWLGAPFVRVLSRRSVRAISPEQTSQKVEHGRLPEDTIASMMLKAERPGSPGRRDGT
jgi:hypothetical protein